uniref:Uncharacterized protein n=2 Tax=Tetraselmis sp. GSL018 TaxID=582737 RepID=A0A061QU05_9CHLO
MRIFLFARFLSKKQIPWKETIHRWHKQHEASARSPRVIPRRGIGSPELRSQSRAPITSSVSRNENGNTDARISAHVPFFGHSCPIDICQRSVIARGQQRAVPRR